MLCFSIWQDQPDSYDKLVKEMALEMRARPSDRTKTPEEIAQEERERLEHLEVWLHACSKFVICLYRCIAHCRWSICATFCGLSTFIMGLIWTCSTV